MESIEQFVARWQKSEARPIEYYLKEGKIRYGEQIQAMWYELMPYLRDKGFLVQGAQSVEQLGLDLHFYGVSQRNAPKSDGEYHVFLQVGKALLYVGAMYVCSNYRPLNALYCDMHDWKTEIILH